MSKICGIYKITSPTGKVYIGQSRDVKQRFIKHRYKSKTSLSSPILYNSFRKYKIETHIFKIIHELPTDVSQEILNNYEIFYIECYKELSIGIMNVKGGGHNGTMNEFSKQKLREANLGKKVSNETKKKISEALKISAGHSINQATRDKISLKLTGRKISEEILKKASKAIKEGYDNGTMKKIQGEEHYFCKLSWENVCDIRDKYNTGNYSQVNLAKQYNLDPGYISQIINFKYRKTK